MDERMDSLGEATKFSALEANSNYWHVEIDQCDCKKAVFKSSLDCQFVRMPFGLKKAHHIL